MNEMTETLIIGDGEYEIKRRLGWMEQQRIDDMGFRLFVNGRAFSEADNIEDIEELEIRMDNTAQNLARLRARLVGVKRSAVSQLPPAHVAILVERIAELEKEEKAEVEALKEGNPTGTPSSASSATPSCEASTRTSVAL